jgi:hypothetical protein
MIYCIYNTYIYIYNTYIYILYIYPICFGPHLALGKEPPNWGTAFRLTEQVPALAAIPTATVRRDARGTVEGQLSFQRLQRV